MKTAEVRSQKSEAKWKALFLGGDRCFGIALRGALQCFNMTEDAANEICDLLNLKTEQRRSQTAATWK